MDSFVQRNYPDKWCRYRPKWNELLQLLAAKGLKNCRMEMVKLTVIPDNTKDETEFLARERALYENELSVAEVMQNCGSDEEAQIAAEYAELLDKRIMERLEMFRRDKHLWEYCETDLLVTYGWKTDGRHPDGRHPDG